MNNGNPLRYFYVYNLKSFENFFETSFSFCLLTVQREQIRVEVLCSGMVSTCILLKGISFWCVPLLDVKYIYHVPHYISLYMVFTGFCCIFILYRLVISSEDAQNKDPRSFAQAMVIKIKEVLAKAKVPPFETIPPLLKLYADKYELIIHES